MDLNYPEHKHPHSFANLPPNEHRIWVCPECLEIWKCEMKNKSRNFIHWSIIYPLLSLCATIYSVIHLKNSGINPTDIILVAVMGIIITYTQLVYYLTRIEK